MRKQLFLATIVMGFIANAAWAQDHAIMADEMADEAPPYATAMIGTREICTTRELVGGVRTECRIEALPVDQPNPLKGICITAYGNRTCY
jgi:hypothetical protein